VKNFSFNAAQTHEIIKLMDAKNAAHVSSSTHRVIKNRKWLIIAEKEQWDAQILVIEEDEKKMCFSLGTLHVSKLLNGDYSIHQDPAIAMIDLGKINFPLLLRKSKPGDYFYPLGMQKKKKISRFLIDLKLSKTQKENCWVIESNQKIVWVVGYRIDDRFKLPIKADNILQLQLIPTDF
jgi:tRNA(Ile)-lysidine synthase